MEPEKKPLETTNRIDYISQFIILVLIALTPLFFIPSVFIPLAFSKAILLYGAVIISFCAWIISRLREGKLTIPQHYFFIALALIPITHALSAIFSDSRAVSFFGQGFETQTFGFVLALSLLTFITASTFISKKAITLSYLVLLVPFPLIALYHLIRIIVGSQFLAFNVFFANTASLLGGWNDLGIYCGLIALFTFITLELLPLEAWMRAILTILLAVALFFLTVINFSLAWYVFGAIALIFFIYNFSYHRSKLQAESSNSIQQRLPILSIIVIIIAFIFIFVRGNIYNTLASAPFNLPGVHKFNIANTEVRPSWSSTITVAKQSLKQDPLFGVGPNRFSNSWQLWKAADVNKTIFWATDFNAATGYVPTAMITTGILGTLAWIAFLGLFLYSGFRVLFRRLDVVSHYLTTSTFIVALYLWIFAFSYIPSASILILTFFFTGLFFASLTDAGVLRYASYDFVKYPRISFISVLIFIVLILGTLLYGYTIVRKFVASVYFNQGLAIVDTNGNVDDVESHVNTALRFNESDLYYRVLTNISLARLRTLVANQNTMATSTVESQFTSIYSMALASSQKAVDLDRSNYQNWVTAGVVYDVFVQLGNQEAYIRALNAYTEASKLNPTSPSIYLNLARLEVAHKNNARAKEYIDKALSLKNNYTDAIFLLSQIQVSEGDIKSAIQSVQSEATLTPNDPGVHFELGLLHYNNKDYRSAAAVFERAISLVPDYANAKYFLGLSYYRLGRMQDAIKQFQDLTVSNPNNVEIHNILSNLVVGKDPFANATDNKPEKRSKPPVEDTDASEISSTENQ